MLTPLCIRFKTISDIAENTSEACLYGFEIGETIFKVVGNALEVVLTYIGCQSAVSFSRVDMGRGHQRLICPCGHPSETSTIQKTFDTRTFNFLNLC